MERSGLDEKAELKKQHPGAPMLIYEVHLGSWIRIGGDFVNYKDIGPLPGRLCQRYGLYPY